MPRYFATVRGDTRICNFNNSSSAILFSPQVGFSRFIFRISVLIFFGSAGRPEGRDFHRQKRRNASRCHRKKVSGLTITSASRQAKSFPSPAIVHRRVIEVGLRFTLRSWYRASCFRRNRFSAANATRDLKAIRASWQRSAVSSKIKNGKSTVLWYRLAAIA